MFHIARKFERIHKEVREWRKYSFGNILKEKKSTEKNLESLQTCLVEGNTSTKHQQEERDFQDRWNILFKWEEIFQKQRSRVQWLEEGDRNMTFFHRLTSRRKKRNIINLLLDDNGQEVTEVEQIESKANSYFQEIYNPPAAQVNSNLQSDILMSFQPVINEQMNDT